MHYREVNAYALNRKVSRIICSLHKKEYNLYEEKKLVPPIKTNEQKKTFYFWLNKRQFSWSMWIFMSLHCYCCCCKNHEFGVRFFRNIFLVVSNGLHNGNEKRIRAFERSIKNKTAKKNSDSIQILNESMMELGLWEKYESSFCLMRFFFSVINFQKKFSFVFFQQWTMTMPINCLHETEQKTKWLGTGIEQDPLAQYHSNDGDLT